MNRYFCLIPARGGSKGLTRKNLRLLAGKPLIVHTIKAALAAGFTVVYVSSDDSEILAVAEKAGALPIMRPAILATDNASSHDVMLHALGETKTSAEHCVLLQPTSPLRNEHHIREAIAQYEAQTVNSLMSVCVSGHHPYKSLRIEDGMLQSLIGSGEFLHMPRQALPAAYDQNGAIYITRIEPFKAHGSFMIPPCAPYIMERSASIDIDDEYDLTCAEAILTTRG